MNNVRLDVLENERIKFLKEHGLDEKSIKKFRSKIQELPGVEGVLTADNRGSELFETISSKSYNDDDYEKIIDLIYRGANIEYKNSAKGDFPLLICARKNHFKTFMALLKAGANVNQVNDYHTTALMAAARHGNEEILEVLIIMGADINARCNDGDTALASAKRHNQTECFNMLVKAQSNLNNRNVENKGMMDLKGTVDLSIVDNHTDVAPLVSEEDVTNLLTEAIEEMQKIINR